MPPAGAPAQQPPGPGRRGRPLRHRLPLTPLLVGLLLWVGGALAVGLFASRQIEGALMNRTAAVTSLYVQTLFEPHLQGLVNEARVDPAEASAISAILARAQPTSNTVAFKVWSPDGEIVYSPDARLIGQRFPVTGTLASAVSGSTVLEISDLRDAENVEERGRWTSLMETYVPLRDQSTGRVIGAAEVYQLPDQLAADIAAAERGVWIGIAAAAVLSYLLMTWLVARSRRGTARRAGAADDAASAADDLLDGKRDARAATGIHSAPAPEQRQAAMHLVERTTAERRDVDAALRVGPAQNLAGALLGVEAIRSGMSPGQRHRAEGNLALIDRAITEAIREIRAIADGLRTPDLAELPFHEVVERAIRATRRGAGAALRVTLGAAPAGIAPATKIALFQAIHDAVAFAADEHHATTITVVAGSEGEWLNLRVAGRRAAPDPDLRMDARGAADPPTPPASAGDAFGLAGDGGSHPHASLTRARDHAILLGGSLDIRSESGGIVIVTAKWPLSAEA